MIKLDKLERDLSNKESIFTMLASEDVLKEDWDNEFDKGWDNI